MRFFRLCSALLFRNLIAVSLEAAIRRATSQSHKRRQNIVHFLIHLFCIGVYLLPLLTHSFAISKPVLDEAHIVSSENKDVSGEAVWYEALYNDYWGRPMTSSSSHKSWRPLTIWSFRFLGGDLWVHRVFNVITHAACAELVSTLLTTDYTTRILIKLLVCTPSDSRRSDGKCSQSTAFTRMPLCSRTFQSITAYTGSCNL